MPRYLLAPVLLLVSALLIAAPSVQAQVVSLPSLETQADEAPIQLAQAMQPRQAPARSSYAEMKDRYNKWTVGLAAGLYVGAGARMASELSKALDADDMRVLPVLTKGLFDNVYDLLYLKGIDIAIVNGDILDHFKNSDEAGVVTQRINYIANLYLGEVHLLARPDINSIQDLAGKVVNFNTKSSATGYTGPLIFDRLGIKVIQNFEPHSKAAAEMVQGGNVAAVMFASSKPLSQFQKNFPPGFKFLSVPYNKKLSDLYLPSDLTHEDYPNLIPAGQSVETVAVPTLLAAYDWPQDNDRYRRMVHFVDRLFEQLPALQQTPGNNAKWKELSLTGEVPGWKRYPPMQKRLDEARAQLAAPRPSGSSAGMVPDIDMARQMARGMTKDPREQERIVREFLEWSRTRH